MNSKKKYLALFIAISLLLTACDSMGVSRRSEQDMQSAEAIELSEITDLISQEQVGTDKELQTSILQAGVENVLQKGINLQK